MLVISRKPGESFIIGDNTRVQVIRVQGGRVKLAIQAPAEVIIRRQELVADDEKGSRGTSSQTEQFPVASIEHELATQ